MAVQPFDVHDFKTNGFSGDLPSLEALGFGDFIGQNKNPDLLETVVNFLNGDCQRKDVTRRIKLCSHLSFGAEAEKTYALLDRHPSIRIGNGGELVDSFV